MSAIGSISSASAALVTQIQQSAPTQKAAQTQASPQDTVQLSKAALSALGSGDADHDGDSH